MSPDTSAKRWLEMLKDAEAAERSYHARCDKIDALYADLDKLAENKADREFQIFWANMGVLKPTIYSREPVPVVTSRFRDRKALPRRAAEILERAQQSDIELDDLHDTLILARDDLAINARGVIWVRFGERDGMEVPLAEHIDRQDFRHEPARKWSEVGWVARRAFMTREEVEKRFPDANTEGMIFKEYRQGQDSAVKSDDQKGEKKAGVWELWHKDKKAVVWVSEGVETVLDQRKPWMTLKGFFPCPKPAYGTLKRRTLVPVPDFVYYRDQIEEINELTARISALAAALRLRGFYPAGNPDVGDAIEAAMRNMDNSAILIPISSMAAMGTMSLKDAIVWLPVRDVAEVIIQLVALRKEIIQDVYEITGLSDIMRGATNAQETLGAQQLKSQFGSVRVSERQGEMARLARDVLRIKAEVMAENMPLADLLAMAQVDDLPTDADIAAQAAPVQQQMQQLQAQANVAMMQLAAMPPEQAQPQIQAIQQQLAQQAGPLQRQLRQIGETVTQEQVAALFQSQKTRPFVLEIETDSTIEPNEMADRERRVAFSQALAPLIQQGVMAMQMAPQLGPFVAESIRYMASGFRAGRQMDDAIDKLAEGFEQYQPPPQEQAPGEDPEAARMTAQAAQTKAEADAANAKSQAEASAAEIPLKQAETGAKVELIRAQTQKVLAEIGKTRIEANAVQMGEAREDQRTQHEMARSEGEDERAENESKAKIGAMAMRNED